MAVLTASQIESYLARIGIRQNLSPDTESLFRLQKFHLLSVPFENLDIHKGKEIVLNAERFYTKIVDDRRGGFCYELNGLFFELLVSTGFNATIVSGRVSDGNGGFGNEFDHLAIAVKIEDSQYLADVGFGEFTSVPLKIVCNEIQDDERGKFLIKQFDEEYLLVTKLEAGRYEDQYIFSLKPRRLDDFALMCRYHQTSPGSHFTQKKLCSMPIEGGRKTLTDKVFKVTNGGMTTETEVRSEIHFSKLLQDEFGIMIS